MSLVWGTAGIIVTTVTAEKDRVETLTVECLRCGEQHELRRSSSRLVQQGECPRCGYVGWAESSQVDEALRRALRERPVESRRIRLLAG